MDIVQHVQHALESERELRKLLDELLSDICNSVLSALEEAGTMEGVKPLGGGCYSVSFSTVMQNDNLSAEYYSPEAQMRLVKKVLEKAPTMTSLVEKLREMVDKGSVRVDNVSYKLNPVTVSVLERFCVPDDKLVKE